MCGGYNGSVYLDDCEILSSTSNDSWRLLEAVMPFAMYGASGVSHGRFLYVIGGRSRNGSYVDRSNVLRYDTESVGRWEEMTPLKTKRYGAASVVRQTDEGNATIVVCGGGNPSILSSCESYDISTNSWATFPSMRRPRLAFGLVEWKGKLTAIGGRTLLASIEQFDDEENRWFLSAVSLPQARWDFSVVKWK